MVGTKVWDNEMGWGEIVFETENYLIARWDADPHSVTQYPR